MIGLAEFWVSVGGQQMILCAYNGFVEKLAGRSKLPSSSSSRNGGENFMVSLLRKSVYHLAAIAQYKNVKGDRLVLTVLSPR